MRKSRAPRPTPSAALVLSLIPSSARSLDVRIQMISSRSPRPPPPPRATHFVALRMPSPSLRSAVAKLQEQLILLEPGAKGTAVPPEKNHLTAFVLSLQTANALSRAKGALHSCHQLAPAPPPSVHLRGLGHFSTRVCYVPCVEDESLRHVETLVSTYKAIFRAHGFDVANEPWTAHLTLLKTSRLKRPAAAKIRPARFADVVPPDLGKYSLATLELCAMAGVAADGFYRVEECVSVAAPPLPAV